MSRAPQQISGIPECRSLRPAPKPAATVNRPVYNEPTYHPIGMNAEGQNNGNNRFMS